MRKMLGKLESPVFATLLVLKAIMLVAVLAGCTTAPDIRIDKAPAANLAGYRTFAFHDHLPTDRGTAYTSLMTSHLRQSTRNELERHGYVYDERSPDLKVSFDVKITERQELRSFPTSNGIFVRRAGPQDYGIVNYSQGTVSIDLVDNHLKSVIWQGVADGRVDDRMIEDPGKAIDNVVKHIFVGFPLSHGELSAAR